MSTLTDQAADNDILLKEGPAMDALTVLRANKRFPLTNRLERSVRIPFLASSAASRHVRQRPTDA